MERKRIWIVSELFYPDEASTGYIMTAIAKAFAECEVHVICGPKGYDSLREEDPDTELPFKIHRVRTLNLSKNNISQRLIRLVLLSIGMFFKGVFYLRKTDVVLIVTNPAFIIPFYAFIKWLKGNKLVVLVHDVFPENLLASQIIRSQVNVWYRITQRIFNWSYNQADLLIVLGRDMLDIMRTKVKQEQEITVIENWANIEEISPVVFEENPLIKQLNLSEKIVFTFAGNIGRVQGLEFLFRIIKQIKNPHVHFLFVGDGALLNSLKNQAETDQLTCVTFVGAMPRSKQNVFLNAGHFGLVTLNPALYGLGVPSKTYNIMAAGKPIVFIGNKNSEIAEMLVNQNCGYVFDDDDEKELIVFFNELDASKLIEAAGMGQIARRLAESRYSKEYILNRFREEVL